MSLEKIMSIGGRPGLFRLVTQSRTGFVAESLLDGKKISVGMTGNVSLLTEIAIYTLEEELPLRSVFGKIQEMESGGKTRISQPYSLQSAHHTLLAVKHIAALFIHFGSLI